MTGVQLEKYISTKKEDNLEETTKEVRTSVTEQKTVYF